MIKTGYLPTLGEIGIEDEDILDVVPAHLPDGGYEVNYYFTERGHAIIENFAEMIGMEVGEYLHKTFMQQIHNMSGAFTQPCDLQDNEPAS